MRERSSQLLGGAGPGGRRLSFASSRRPLARGLGAGVSGWARRVRICGGSVCVIVVLAVGVWEEAVDFRREEMMSFTEGGASFPTSACELLLASSCC